MATCHRQPVVSQAPLKLVLIHYSKIFDSIKFLKEICIVLVVFRSFNKFKYEKVSIREGQVVLLERKKK